MKQRTSQSVSSCFSHAGTATSATHLRTFNTNVRLLVFKGLLNTIPGKINSDSCRGQETILIKSTRNHLTLVTLKLILV